MTASYDDVASLSDASICCSKESDQWEGEMAGEPKVPYLQAYGNITKALEKIKTASTPDRFTQDFLATKLGLSGGGAKPVIPFLKRTGFLGSDGSPTPRYVRFRGNAAASGSAAAEALRDGYAALYEINEYAHAASDDDLKGYVLQATGVDESSSTVRAIIKSFRALQAFADFEADPHEGAEDTASRDDADADGGDAATGRDGRLGDRRINLGYTINLHLPATSDIAVFNAIFKSLREHILRD
jgi:hypothetical protein